MEERTVIMKISPRWGGSEYGKSFLIPLLVFLYICLVPHMVSTRYVTDKYDLGHLGRFEEIRPLIEEISKDLGVSPALASAVIKAESDFRTQAVSPKGAVGLMQVLPSTARLFGVKNPLNPRENIRAGLLYLRGLRQQFGNLDLALAAYNAGPGAVIRHGKIPPYKETERYVPKVKKYYNEFKIFYGKM